MRAVEREFIVEAVPAIAAAADEDFCLQFRAACCGKISLVRAVAVGGAYDRGNAGCLEAVFIVVLLEQAGCGDGDGAELMQSEDRIMDRA